ncbi:CoxG family protein [Saccharopolyspora sp. 5N708]|uniref:CoxG family protein n=1 Tax=Saccharopolyspora sp. 5N708 TaxID=3457424 RepID=UPI003FD04EEC
MKLASEFSVPASPEEVFPLLFDPDTMRACIPGCEELARTDERTFRGRLVNEIAHVRFAAGFSAEIQSLTEPSEVRAVLKGEDRRLGSSIKIDARLTVRPDGAGSVIGYEMDVALWGKLGRLGEPIIRRRSREVELEFAKSLAAAAGGQPIGTPKQPETATAPAVPAKPTVVAPAVVAPALVATAPETDQNLRRLVIASSAVAALALIISLITAVRRGR